MDITKELHNVRIYLKNLGIDLNGGRKIYSPTDGSILGQIEDTNLNDEDKCISESKAAFNEWKNVPAPQRGELVRILGSKLREHKEDLAKLVTAEVGKIYQEGLGEVQEMIDICDYAVGLSRQLYGLTMPSERPEHKLMETWHPLGVVGCISAFNFPVAVWSWNFAISTVCGNSMVWKPHQDTPFTALATQAIFQEAVAEFETTTGINVPDGLLNVVIGGADVGQRLTASDDIALVSATGSTRMGYEVAKDVSSRMGKYLLELGGNNAMIVTPDADLDMALKAIVFSAVGTAGQRCTSLRRLIVHNDIKNALVDKLKKVYSTISIGNPFDESNLMGPVFSPNVIQAMDYMLNQLRAQGGVVWGGDKLLQAGYYIKPAIVEMPYQTDLVKKESFMPLLYVIGYDDFEEALSMQNDVPQGLSSCIFSNNIRETERFLAVSDCGIANVNIGTSGSEIGGAFGGEKETGGGRESGSDSWKQYMRRQTNTINYSTETLLAQGINFNV